jgi:hypothetical protein
MIFLTRGGAAILFWIKPDHPSFDLNLVSFITRKHEGLAGQAPTVGTSLILPTSRICFFTRTQCTVYIIFSQVFLMILFHQK